MSGSTHPEADPIVVSGIGIEAPGDITTPTGLFHALAESREMMGPLPRDRGWPIADVLSLGERQGWASVCDSGGFLTGAAEFDAAFFGVTPREAAAADPQQRVAMRVAWRTLEHAGVNPASVAGDEAGCFLGASFSEYGPPAAAANDHSGHRVTGTSLGAVAGRISHHLGLLGPCITVDTACASSLTALQLAVSAIRNGDCDWALAGGVCVMGSPAPFYEFAKNRALSADGHCRSFADDATGTVWGEGAGIVLLERESRARSLGHRVYGQILAVCVNHNGRGDGDRAAPLMVPSASAQERVIRRTLAAAGVSPRDVSMIEGHGTGTPVGDPLELTALQNTYGAADPTWPGPTPTDLAPTQESAGGAPDPGRIGLPEQGPLLGSLKSNVGHAQAASGALGLIKVLVCGDNGAIVPGLHAQTPSARVDWSRSSLRLATTIAPWRPRGGVRYGAVSSFGVSGTNAHAIIGMPDAHSAGAHHV